MSFLLGGLGLIQAPAIMGGLADVLNAVGDMRIKFGVGRNAEKENDLLAFQTMETDQIITDNELAAYDKYLGTSRNDLQLQSIGSLLGGDLLNGVNGLLSGILGLFK